MKYLLLVLSVLFAFESIAQNCITIRSNPHSSLCFSELASEQEVVSNRLKFRTKADDLSPSNVKFYKRASDFATNRCRWSNPIQINSNFIKNQRDGEHFNWIIEGLGNFLLPDESDEILVRIECESGTRCFGFNVGVVRKTPAGIYLATDACEINSVYAGPYDGPNDAISSLVISPNPSNNVIQISIKKSKDVNTSALDPLSIDHLTMDLEDELDLFIINPISQHIFTKMRVKQNTPINIGFLAPDTYEVIVLDKSGRLLGSETLAKN